jgi:DNA-binding transcriptional ArsR family regulator
VCSKKPGPLILTRNHPFDSSMIFHAKSQLGSRYNIFVMVNMFSIDQIATLLQTIGQPARLQILLAIGDGEPCVCHLEATFGWRQSYLSQHLMALRKAGILLTSRQGRNIHYRLSDPRLLSLIRQAAELQGVTLPELAPSPDCSCPNCSTERCEGRQQRIHQPAP